MYATWAGAYAAAQALGTPATIVIDDTLADCLIPEGAGDFDLHRITLSGLGTVYGTILNVGDDVTWNEGFARITGGLVVQTAFTVPTYLITPTTSQTLTMTIDSYSVLTTDGLGGIINITGVTPQIILVLETGAAAASGGNSATPFINIEANAEIIAYVGEYSYLDNYFVVGSLGSVIAEINSTSAEPPTQFTNYTGVTNIEYNTLAVNLLPFTGSGTFPTTANQHVVTGTMYFDQTSGQPFWWNGSAWTGITTVMGVTIQNTPITGKIIVATSSSTAAWEKLTLDGTVQLTGTATAGMVPVAANSFSATWQFPPLSPFDVTFQPGGTAAPGIYTDEASFLAAVSATNATHRVFVDCTFAPSTDYAALGAWNLGSNAILEGVNANLYTSFAISPPPLAISNIILNATGDVGAVFTFAGGSMAINGTRSLSIMNPTGGQVIIEYTGGTNILYLNGDVFFQGNLPAIQVDAGATVLIYIQGTTSDPNSLPMIQQGSLSVAAGGLVTIYTPSPTFVDPSYRTMSGVTVVVPISNIGPVSVSGTPGVGMIPVATSATAASWQNPPGGAGSNVFTYREGEPSPGGNVYATWAGAYAAAHATGVPATIVIDDSISPCVIPEGAGDFDLHLITLTGLAGGVPNPAVVLSVSDGVTWNEGFARITGNLWVLVNFSTTSFLGTLTNVTPYYMRIDGDALLATDNEGATFDCSQSNNPQVYLVLDDGILITNGGSGPFFYTGSGDPTLNLVMDGASYIDDGLVSGSSGYLTITWNSASVLYTPPSNFPSYSGNLSNNYSAQAALLNPFTGNGTFPSVGQPYPFVNTGTMYFDEGSGQPYWWNGEWVTYPSGDSIGGVIVNGIPASTNVLTATSTTTADWQAPTLDGTNTLSGTPSAGNVPTFSNGTSAIWQVPTLDGSVTLSGGPPTAGQIPIATGSSTATWQTPASSVTPNLFIYRSGATPSGNVYSSFDAAYAAALAATAEGVDATIGIDDTEGACTTTPSTAYDLSQITLMGGFGGGQNTLDISNSAITASFSLKHNLILSTTVGNPVTNFNTATANVYLEDNCQITTNAINFWTFVSGTLNIYLGNQCAISGSGGLFYAPTAGTINIYYQGTPSTITSSMAFNYGAPAVVLNNWVIAGSTPLTNFVNYAGTPNFYYETPAANLNPYTGSGALPLPASNPNVLTGTMYFDQTSNQPYWWNGTTWVTPPGTGVSNVFVYRDSEPSPSGVVFSTWVGAYAAAAATGVPATIIIDNTLNGCQIPSGAGNFDLHQITLAGLGRAVGTTLFINDGVTWNEGFARITQGLSVLTFFSSSVYLGTFTSFTNKSMVIDEGSSLYVAVQGGLFNIQTAFNLDITLDSGSFIGSGGDSDMPAFSMNAGTNINLYMGDQTEIDGGFVQGPTGNLSINILSLSAITQTVFSQFSGTLSLNYAANAALLQPFTGSGSFPIVGVVGTNVTIGTMYFDQTSGQPWWWNGSAWVTVNAGVPGVELLTATAGSSQGTPVGNLNTGVQVSILVNTTGAAAFWHLPDGTDGMIKEIVSGGNLGSALISNAFIGITSTNNAYGTNDLTDLNPGNSVRLVWSTAGGGWVAISSCNNASSQWD